MRLIEVELTLITLMVGALFFIVMRDTYVEWKKNRDYRRQYEKNREKRK